jgi:hypothetical protein
MTVTRARDQKHQLIPTRCPGAPVGDSLWGHDEQKPANIHQKPPVESPAEQAEKALTRARDRNNQLIPTRSYPPGARAHREEILSGAKKNRNRRTSAISPLLNLLPSAQKKLSPGPGIATTSSYPPGARVPREEILSGAVKDRNRLIHTGSPW